MNSKRPHGQRGRRRTVVALAAVVTLGLVTTGCSKTSDTAAETRSNSNSSGSASAELPDGVPAVFDASILHSIEVSFDQDAYDDMLMTYKESGTKDWIEATVTIDGQTFKKVGMKLKGNSSLRGVSGGTGGRGQPARGGATANRSGADAENAPSTSTTDGTGTGSTTTDDTSTDKASTNVDPVTLPWRIRFDKFVNDQTYQGYADIVVRSNNSATSLNEAVALELLSEAGLASEASASTSFSVNGSDPTLRLMVELPDDDAWQDANFSESGALYKAESTGDWSYRGEDQTEYAEAFEQKGGKKTTDLAPLVDFLEFLNNSDDETFEAELPDRLDVDAFATYLAMMDLIDNFDDISGPGNNSYLWWDATTKKFTVVPWDMNLAFGVGMGGGGGGGGGRGNGTLGGPVTGGATPPDGMQPPDGVQPPDGIGLPEGTAPPDGFERPDGVQRQGRPGGNMGPPGNMGGRSNPLVDRFHDTESFEKIYQEKLTELRETLFESGRAVEILDARASTLSETATDLVDANTITSDVEAIREKISD